MKKSLDDRIFEAWRKANRLTIQEVSQKILGLAQTSITNPRARKKHIERIVRILASKGVETQFFFKCPQCGYLNPNDRTEEEAEEGPYMCEGCGYQITN